MTIPNIEFKRVGQFSLRDVNSLPLAIDVNGVTTNELLGNHNGFLDPGETIRVRIPLSNYTTNDISAEDARNVSALLTSETPGVVALQPLGNYGRIDSGETTPGTLTYLLRIQPGFDPGTPINLRLATFGRFGGGGSFELGTLRHRLFTGTPQVTTLLTENFDAAAVGTLPAGWSRCTAAERISFPGSRATRSAEPRVMPRFTRTRMTTAPATRLASSVCSARTSRSRPIPTT